MRDPTRIHATRFAVLIVGLLCLWLLGYALALDLATLERGFASIPPWLSGAVFVAAYVVGTFFIWLSKDLLRIFAALTFGPWGSTLLVWLAESANAAVLFHLSRRMGRAYIEERFALHHPALDVRLAGLPFAWLLMFRAAPLIAFRFLDLAAGLTRMSFRRYFAAVAVGSLPRILWLQLILAGVGRAILTDPLASAHYLQEHPEATCATATLGLLMVAVAWRVRRLPPPVPPQA